MPRSALLPLGLLAVACTATDSREQLVTIDTLPGGIPVVMTAAPIDSGRWALIHERDIQPAAGEQGELSNPQDIAIRDDGTIAVAESGPAVVHIYGPDGSFQRDIGREGEGPGEFRAAFLALRGDTLVVQDPRNIRATSFDLRDGSVLVARSTACCEWAPIMIDRQGRAVARMMARTNAINTGMQGFIRFPIGGTTAESLAVPERATEPGWRIGDGEQTVMIMAVPMQPRSWHAPAPSGDFVSGWSGEYRLWRTRTGTDTLQVFGRPWIAGPVSDQEKQAIVEARIAETLGSGMGLTEEQLRASLDPALMPGRRPAFEGIWVDDVGRTWVRLSSADTAVVHLDLFDADGRWLDQVAADIPEWASSSYTPLAIAADRLAVLGTDDDGVPIVRVYRLARRG